MLDASHHIVIELTKFVSWRRQVKLFEQVDLKVARMHKLFNCLSFCENILHSDRVNLIRKTGLAIVDHKGILEDAHELVVPNSWIRPRYAWDAQHFDLFSCSV